MRILFLGDVNGDLGLDAVDQTLSGWKEEYRPDLVIANAENSDNGFGATPRTLDRLLAAGVDAFTMGDHCFDKDFSDIADYPIVRPANVKESGPGEGVRLLETAGGEKLLLMNLVGFAFMKRAGHDYFQSADDLLAAWMPSSPDAIFLDFHAEATSETTSLGYYLDGRVSAVVGTHTHIPTADTHLLPKGTAFQCDVGMCGAVESVIGMTPQSSLAFLKKEMGIKVERKGPAGATNPPYACDAVLVETKDAGAAKSINRISSRPYVSPGAARRGRQ